jgi:hypothetical protein
MDDELHAREPYRRLRAMQVLAPQKRRLIDDLLAGSALRAWPFGMPTSIAPLVVVIGVSPGNSPNASEVEIAPARPYPEPTFAQPNPGLFYLDRSHYWKKVRELMMMAVSRYDFDLEMKPDLALALCGHLNLGVNLAGRGTFAAVDDDITRWVSRVVKHMRPRLIVGLGLVGLLVNPPAAERARAERLRQAWEDGGMITAWDAAWRIEGANVNGHPYAFRYQTTLIDNDVTSILLWPNHPSRAPFAGAGGEGSRWAESVEAARIVLDRMKPSDLDDA